MARLTRAETQERNRARVLAAAKEEFAARGYRDAKIDAIAEAAGLTRGAVYSNFPSKRALYFAVLAHLASPAAEDTFTTNRGTETGRALGGVSPDAEAAFGGTRGARAGTSAGAGYVEVAGHAAPAVRGGDPVGAFARWWVGGLPLASAESEAWLGVDLVGEVLGDERTRRVYGQLLKLDALLLGLAMERVRVVGTQAERLERIRQPAVPHGRLVPVAEAVLTTLHGARQLAAAAAGFVEPFDVIKVCERLAGAELDTGWAPAHLPWAPPARPVDEPWSPPPAVDAVRGASARLGGGEGVVVVVGLQRAEAVEEAVRAAPAGVGVTAVLVTSDPAELGPLARLVVGELCTGVREAFPQEAWPGLQVVFDEPGSVAAAAGVAAVSDETEVAVRVRDGRIVARAEGRGAAHAAATAAVPSASRG
ncbi:TetR/AcrR family transcriptional regulator [Nonomuraea sediminis]|uniref:TetR/AcrR family transcriptional regulator n=1 Tax=Nonomuraea sediminis TaxID=2835864 RepID=UPI00202AB290|nr:helix-turn-helix domain-containing protein [Nonomuraea sediminis]